jgi:hypothetical protein
MSQPASQVMDQLITTATKAPVIVLRAHVPAVNEHIGLGQQRGHAGRGWPGPQLGQPVSGEAEQGQVTSAPRQPDDLGQAARLLHRLTAREGEASNGGVGEQCFSKIGRGNPAARARWYPVRSDAARTAERAALHPGNRT